MTRMTRITGGLARLRALMVGAACVTVVASAMLGRATPSRGADEPAPTVAPSAPATPGTGATSPPKLVRTSMGEAFFIQRNPLTHKVEWVGTLIVWGLIGLSILCTSLIGTLLWGHRKPAYTPASLVEALKRALYEGKLEPAFRAVAGDGSMLAGVMAASLRQAAHGHGAMTRAAEQRADEIAVQKLRSIEPLNVIGNVAPMLGLFGTVYGIILSFREIVASGGTPDPVSLAAGIGTALVATFWGLVVAIPALAFYGVLRSRIDGYTVEASSAAEDLLSQFKPAPPKV